MRSTTVFARVCAVTLSLLLLPIQQPLCAQDHVVSASQLQKDVATASQTRQENLDKVQKFLGSDQARNALKSVSIPYEKVQRGVAGLNDEELARLAARTDQAQKDFAAGRISDRDLIFILLGIAALVLIIVAVR